MSRSNNIKDSNSHRRFTTKFIVDIFVQLLLIITIILLILNGINVFPHRDYSRLHGMITEPNAIEGKAIQLYPEGGLVAKDIQSSIHSSKFLHRTNGLSLNEIPARSLLVNKNNKTSSIPTELTLPENSILISDSSGLSALSADIANTVLTFNGNNIEWSPLVDHLPNLPPGNILIGNGDNKSIARAVTGVINLDSNGVTSLVPNAIKQDNVSNNSVTADKIIAGENGQVLTSFNQRAAWMYPQNDIFVSTVNEGNQQSGGVQQYASHTYSIHTLQQGQSISFEAYGSSIADNFIKLGIQIGVTSLTDYLLDVQETTFDWKLAGELLHLPASGSIVGKLNIKLITTNSTIQFKTFDISNITLDLNTLFNITVVCDIPSGVSPATNSVQCTYSYVNHTRPVSIVLP